MEAFSSTIDKHLKTNFETLAELGPKNSYAAKFDALNEGLEEDNFSSAGELRASINPELAFIDGGDELRPIIPATALAVLSNEARLLAIGDTLYRFDRESVNAFLYSGDIEASLAAGPASVRSTSSEVLSSRSDNKACDVGTGSKRRMKGEFQLNQTGLYNELKLITKHQQKILGTWTRKKASYLEHSYDVELINSFKEWFDKDGSHSRNDEAHISSHVEVNAGSGRILNCNKDFRNAEADHKAEYKGNTVTCSTWRCR